MEQLEEQLEFDLWVEERVSAYDLTRKPNPRIAELYHRAYVYGDAKVILRQDPLSMHYTIRYQV